MPNVQTALRLLSIILMVWAMWFPAVAAAQTPDALTVTSVIIDKTAANAVLAREEALTDARRVAFRKLAEKHMTPAAAMDLPLPDDSVLATLVQDVEIKRERLSATRYVGDFTVRFRDGVRQHIPLMTSAADTGLDMNGPVTAATDGQAVSPMAAPAPGRLTLKAPVLLLPYLQNISGQMVLWGEPNPWRDLWQNRPPKVTAILPPVAAAAADGKVMVPLGDIADIASGPDAGVWSGDYSAIEKLRQHYAVDTVMLAVANRSGMQMTVDLYAYQSGGLVRRGQLRPVTNPGLDDVAAYGIAADMTLREILTGDPTTETGRDGAAADQVLTAISQDLTAGPSGAGTGANPSAPLSGPGARVPAAMQFNDFMTWMETQKRLADIVPQVRVDIQTISRNHARFTLGFDGDIATLTAVLAEKGMRLSQVGGTDYELTLVQ